MVYQARGGPFISPPDLTRVFNSAHNDGVRYLAIIRENFSEKTICARSEDALMRQIRYEGLCPDGQPYKFAWIFDFTRDFTTQFAMQRAETVAHILSETTQQAYARYLAELEAKKVRAQNKGGLEKALKGNRY